MATCPNCDGYLGDHHGCGGAWRSVANTFGVALVGGVFGVVMASILQDPPSRSPLAVFELLGAILASALWREMKL